MKWTPFTKGIVVKDTLTPGLKAFFDKAGIIGKSNHNKESGDFKARQALGLQLLNFTLRGSSQESVVPPIMHGILRGSGSVFVDGVLVGDTKSSYADGTPNKSYTAKAGDVTIGFNTAYAARWHEHSFVPGGKVPSKQAAANPAMLANVGYKYLEKHLKADHNILWQLYAIIFKKEMQT